MLRWAGALGLAGFLTGFLGPLFLSRSNQGPMVGLFISGPGGVLIGAVLGAIVGRLRLSVRMSRVALFAATAAMALITLYLCIPEPRRRADIADLVISGCGAADALKSEAIAHWRAEEASRPDRGRWPAHDWSAEIEQALARTPGVAIEAQVARVMPLYEARAAWNYGALLPGRWRTTNAAERYFASGATCAAFAPGARKRLVIRGGVGGWPPYGAAELLGLRRAEPPAPDEAALTGG
ncbi:MAG: hypothetical protein KGL46_07210 [Hyphomicrobiales bacterium]|nr:hypothetical protein [Hyphomicrobiales bacterium]